MLWIPHVVTEELKISQLYTFFRNKCLSGFEFIGEEHNFWECMLVLDGSIEVNANGKAHTLTKDMMIFHKPLEFHSFKITDDNGAEYVVFSFDLEGSFIDHYYGKVYKLNDVQKGIMSNLLDYAQKIVKKNNLEKYNNFLKAGEIYPAYYQILCTFFYQLLFSFADSGTLKSIVKTKDAIIYKEATEYMKENLDKTLSVDDIADKLNVSASALKRIFAKYTGMGVHKYFLLLKLKTATTMLKDGVPINEIANDLNFSSQGNFSAIYKRELGINPSEVKQSLE